MKNNERGLKGFVKSFQYAITGIISSIVSERNIRIHLVVTLYILYFSRFYSLSRAEYILLILTICFVIATEMLNTAIETVVDLVTDAYARLAKIAKDVAAGAVLVAAFSAVVVGVILFFDIGIIQNILLYFAASWVRVVLLLLSVAVAILFIVKAGRWANKAESSNNLNYGGKDAQNQK
ncbi:diacylglycerol kinase family protein [Acetanaerobacterium elongatum]|uniref:Diacylglycerol kinase (ATP) n=1 Tax=Acetanaerobacterium elongatum TaxID=258515 RepID=A0A1H0A446_9FIRM|nr:diacylglycerol kinase family protein [Acetanaerobacterium elongatum]SDN27743.1 diacylglycerol kinase (ATP) [Acetanaerobacterium elongatum]